MFSAGIPASERCTVHLGTYTLPAWLSFVAFVLLLAQAPVPAAAQTPPMMMREAEFQRMPEVQQEAYLRGVHDALTTISAATLAANLAKMDTRPILAQITRTSVCTHSHDYSDVVGAGIDGGLTTGDAKVLGVPLTNVAVAGHIVEAFQNLCPH
jgi:hypothetical protein